jgi:hypothetical protein
VALGHSWDLWSEMRHRVINHLSEILYLLSDVDERACDGLARPRQRQEGPAILVPIASVYMEVMSLKMVLYMELTAVRTVKPVIHEHTRLLPG